MAGGRNFARTGTLRFPAVPFVASYWLLATGYWQAGEPKVLLVRRPDRRRLSFLNEALKNLPFPHFESMGVSIDLHDTRKP
jgi:hypothetical protein